MKNIKKEEKKPGIIKWDKKTAFFTGALAGLLTDWLIADQIARIFPVLYTRLFGIYLDIMGLIEFSVWGILSLIFYIKKSDKWFWFCLGPLVLGLGSMAVLHLLRLFGIEITYPIEF
jgi:hypothetical protein